MTNPTTIISQACFERGCPCHDHNDPDDSGVLTSRIELEVEARKVYGKFNYYPINHTAELLAHIAGTTTLTMQTIKLARDMGLIVNIRAETPEEEALL